jgi:hypothetical protein
MSTSVSSQIDAMVAAQQTAADGLASVGADLTGQPVPRPGMIFNSDSGKVEIHGDYAAPVAGQAPTPIRDSGYDPQATADQMHANVASLQEKLDAHTLNATTGEKLFTVTGRGREVLSLQLPRRVSPPPTSATASMRLPLSDQPASRNRSASCSMQLPAQRSAVATRSGLRRSMKLWRRKRPQPLPASSLKLAGSTDEPTTFKHRSTTRPATWPGGGAEQNAAAPTVRGSCAWASAHVPDTPRQSIPRSPISSNGSLDVRRVLRTKS